MGEARRRKLLGFGPRKRTPSLPTPPDFTLLDQEDAVANDARRSRAQARVAAALAMALGSFGPGHRR